MARNTSAALSNSPSIVTNIPVAGAVTAGELVTMNEIGYASTSGTLLTLENNTAGMANVASNSSPTGSVTMTGRANTRATQMVNLGDNYTIASIHWNPSSANVVVSLNTAPNGFVGDNVYTVTTDTVIDAGIVAIGTTGFVVWWVVNSTGVVKFVYYVNTLSFASLSSGPAVLASTVSSNFDQVTAVYNPTSTHLHFLYNKAGSLTMIRYTTGGVVVGTEQTVEASASPTFISIKALSNGDTIYTWFRNTTGFAWKFVRVVGGSIGTVTTLVTAASNNYWTFGYSDKIMADTGGGTFVCAAMTGSNQYFYKVDATVNITPFLTTTNYSATIAPVVAVNNQGNAVMISSVGSTNTIQAQGVWDISGNVIFAYQNVTSLPAMGTTYSGLDVVTVGGGWVILRQADQTTSSGTITLVRLFPALYGPLGLGTAYYSVSTLNAYTSATLDRSACIVRVPNSNNGTLIMWGSSSTCTRSYAKIFNAAVFGVAMNTAAAGGTINIAVTGSYTLPSYQYFPGCVTFNNKATTVIGNQAVVTGRNVFLNGIV